MDIEKRLKSLERAKEMLADFEDFQMFALHRESGKTGVASFFTDGSKNITVFEGNGDGSEDRDMDYETFVKEYEFCIAHEFEKIPLFFDLDYENPPYFDI